MNLQTSSDKKRITFIGLLFITYYSLLACDNRPAFLYGGYIIVAGFIIADKLLSKERFSVVFPTGCKLLYYFTVFCYFSRIWAKEEYWVVEHSKFLIPVMIFMVISINYFVKIRSSKACIHAIIFSGLALSVYVIVQNGGLSSFYQLATQTGNRIGGEITNVNTIGMICAFSVVVLFYYGMLRKKLFCYLLAILPFVVSMATGSRKAIILVVAGVLILLFLSKKDEKGVAKYLKLLVLLLVLYIGLQFVLSLDIMATINMRMKNMIEDFFGSSTAVTTQNASARLRARFIEVGLEQFKETPFLGVGFGNSRIVNWQRTGYYAYSHNDYIEHMVNGGIVSLLLYYGTAVYLAIKHIKLMKVNKKPELIISFTTLILFFIMSAACVTYYGSITTYLYFTLWISEVAICEREQFENEQQKILQEGNQ